METTDLITSFFSNEMNPEQERTFLLSVAASDSMRLGLKSHVMIDRILLKQAERVHVPEPLRQTIMAQAGVAVAMPGDLPSSAPPRAVAPRGAFGSRGVRAIAAALLFIAGGASGYFLHPSDAQSANAIILASGTPRTTNAGVIATPPLVKSQENAISAAKSSVAPSQNLPAAGRVTDAASQLKHAGKVRGTAVTALRRPAASDGDGDPSKSTPLDPASKNRSVVAGSSAVTSDTTGRAGKMPMVGVNGKISKPDDKPEKGNAGPEGDKKIQ